MMSLPSATPIQPHILMCPPEHYAIQYEINPWMNRLRQSDQPTAALQWEQLRHTLLEAGARVTLLPPQPALPDMVFTANAGLIYGSQAILSRFRHPERQGESPHNRVLFQQLGFEVLELPEGLYFEGAGDALFCGETLFAGYRIRSDARGHQAVGQLLHCHVIPLELVDNYYYHLDTCFCPLAVDMAIYFPRAFDDYGRQVIEANIPRLIEVQEDEARRFACNAVVVGRHVVTNTGCPRLHADLRKQGFTPHETPLDEFVKAGGSAKCLTLRLDGEEAAAWKRTVASPAAVAR